MGDCPKLRQTVVGTRQPDIERFIERYPGVKVSRFSGDWGMGAGSLHIGAAPESVTRHDVSVLFAWITVPNNPLGGNPPLMEAFFADGMTRNDVRQLVGFFTGLGEQMDAWTYPPKKEATDA